MTETDTIATAAAATPATEEATDLAALAELTAQRSAVYRLLARLYRVEVDEEFLAELKTMRFPAATGNTAVDTGYRTIATYLSGADAHAITDLAVDYVRAFIGHGIDAYSAAYPFESVYTSPKRLMMQEARDEVLAVYRSEGLDKLPTWKEAEDHIALELEFMAALGDRIVAAAEAEGLPYQIEAEPGVTGTDARSIQISRGGVPTGLVSVPLRYMHTPTEVVSLDDLDATVKLLARFARDLDEDACFVPGMGDAVTEGDGAGAESAAQMQFDETGVE